jgi:dihydrofolate reductase
MKTILYMTISLDGYISRLDGSVDYTLPGTWDSYFTFCKHHGNLIIGRNTYDVMTPDEFVKGCFYIVMTKKPVVESKAENVIFFDGSPKEALELVKSKGFGVAGLGGGGKLNSSFLNSGLVDELLIDIEPIVLGKGIKIFPETNDEFKLELIDDNRLTGQEMQLRYKIKK